MSHSIRFIFAVAFVWLALARPPAVAGESVVVVELFTSQGCSRCPPADAYLAELARRPDIVALSFHVDYWNYIGWRDPFSSTRWSKRQRDYGASLNRRFVYTPQIVVDGRDESIGSRRPRIEALIRAARDRNKLAIDVSHLADDHLRIRIAGGLPADDGEATVWLALYDFKRATIVATGENKGARLTNVNIVRTLERVGTWRGRARRLRRHRAAARHRPHSRRQDGGAALTSLPSTHSPTVQFQARRAPPPR